MLSIYILIASLTYENNIESMRPIEFLSKTNCEIAKLQLIKNFNQKGLEVRAICVEE